MTRTLQRILLVEDDADIATVARLALEGLGGFQVQLCTSGEQALAQAAAFAPDLILLDVMMPGLDGTATFATLRRIEGLDRVPVVFMTAKVQPEEIRRFMALGAADVIPKPFDPLALPEQVRGIWERALR